MLKEKKLTEIEKNQKAEITITTLEGKEFRIEWTVDEIKVLTVKDPGQGHYKETKVGEYYDNLTQFLLVESAAFQKAVCYNVENSKTLEKYRPTIFFVLGRSGTGKRTQCKKLAEEFPNFHHFSAGDCLR